MNIETITIVSGLPRSGTSMMMTMLEAGGMKILTDNIRKPNEDNPRGYYEFAKVKSLEKDSSWIEDARGKTVKVISSLLEQLPEKENYKIIFMQRKIEEILSSQKQMLIRRGETTDNVSDEDMKRMYLKHLKKIEEWLSTQLNIDVIYIHYNDILEYPARHSVIINQFLGNMLNTDSMKMVVDKTLYHQRR